MEKNPWVIKGQKSVYENSWISVTEYDVLNPAGNKGIYGKVHFKNIAVGVMVLDKELNTYLVGQYRFPLNVYRNTSFLNISVYIFLMLRYTENMLLTE